MFMSINHAVNLNIGFQKFVDVKSRLKTLKYYIILVSKVEILLKPPKKLLENVDNFYFNKLKANPESETPEKNHQSMKNGHDKGTDLKGVTEPQELPPDQWHNYESQMTTHSPSEENIGPAENEREHWSNSLQFLMSCIASSVGLGNVWRFPFVAGSNGGGAFLLPYLIVLVFIGRPLYYLEMSIGQFITAGPVKMWEMAPIFRGVGFGCAVVCFCVSTYYNFIIALTVLYTGYSFLSTLPWTLCHSEWPDDVKRNNCIVTNTSNPSWELSPVANGPSLFFDYNVMYDGSKLGLPLEDGLGAPQWHLLICLFISWVLVWLCLAKGVSTSGKIAYFTALFPYFVLTCLLIRGTTLEGAATGILYFITPRFHEIIRPETWYNAVSQCFFSLGVSFGSIVTFSSFNTFQHRLDRDVWIISIMDTLTSLIAGITVFAIMGNIQHANNATDIGTMMEEQKGGGIALAFVSYPRALSSFGDYPFPQIFSFLFFVMLITLGVGSANGMVGTIVTIICDNFPKLKRWMVVTVVCLCGFFGGFIYTTNNGVPMIDLIDFHGGGFIVYVIGLLEIIGIAWVYGLENICMDFEFMFKRKVSLYWVFCWGLILPFFLIIVLVSSLILHTPKAVPLTATAAGWTLSALALSVIPIGAVYVVCTRKSTKWNKRWKASWLPSKKWGPKNSEIKEEWRLFKTGQEHEYKLASKLQRFFHCGRPPWAYEQHELSLHSSTSKLEEVDNKQSDH